MAERPILMSAPMVRAILAGTKTQTRRAVKGAPEDWAPMQPQVFSPTVIDRHGEEQPGPDTYGAGNEDGDCWIRCPYGRPGDLLWVREKWQADPPHDGTWAATAWAGSKPHALSEIPERFRHPRFCNYSADWLHGQIIWRPSIHMPRWASRITLRVTDVRLERLQDISRGDAMAEGCPFPNMAAGDDPRRWFAEIWNTSGATTSWDANPWVWVVSFERVGGGNG